MSRSSRLSLPLLATVLTSTPAVWAFNAGLTPWRGVAAASGWAGLALLLLCLLTMVREPALATRLGGLERMYRWHHGLGLAGYLVLLVHPLALALDAWGETPRLAWQTLWPATQDWPGRTGWISLLCLMTGLAASGWTRLAYPRWRALHALLGVGVFAGAWHAILAMPGTTAVLAAAGALLVLAWRALRVDLGWGAHPYVVQATRPVAAATVEVRLRALAHPLEAIPGQFIMVAFSDAAHFRGCREYHPFTVSRVDGDTLDIDIKGLGDCTKALQHLEPGVPARIQGPFGRFLAGRSPAPELWIAGGVGITPFLAALRARAPAAPTILLYLFRRESDAAYLDELRALAAAMPTLDLQAHATGARDPALGDILACASDLAARHCYLCGPPGLVDAARQALQVRGVPASHIHDERFDFR